MRIVLPYGYRHVGNCLPDHGYDDAHVVPAHHGDPKEGYEVDALCGVHIDTRKSPDGKRQWGTLHDSERKHSDRSGIWNRTCPACAEKVRTAAFIAERLEHEWERRMGQYVREQPFPIAVRSEQGHEALSEAVAVLMADGVIQ